MKRLLLLFWAICLAPVFSANAQCTIDFNQTSPGIYPDTLPDGMVGQFYSEDITFVMPLDTQGFAFTNFHIQSVAGLPFGLSWVCNNSGNGCNYDPAVSQYGCMNVSGTPIQSGTFPIDVTVIASLGVLGDFPAHFYTQVVIQPDTSSNSGFTMAGGFGCLPLTVTFTNGNPGHLAYYWDFGNGATSTQENPSPQIYTQPGSYTVTYEAYDDTVPSYFLTEVQVLGIPNNWGWPGDLNPDIYVELYDGGMNLIHTTATVNDQDPPVTFAMPNIPLADETYTVHVWDEDGGIFGADDDLGSTTFAGHGTSGSSTSGSTSISYTISTVGPFPVVSSTDTVEVFGYPNPPNIDSTGFLLFTDSVNLTLQWYQNGNPVPGADSASFLATESGDYYVLATSPQGCFASSDTIFIAICDPNFEPAITQSGHILFTDSSSYDIQWFHDGNPVAGGTSQLITTNDNGDYWVQLTAWDGCIYTSDTLNVDFTGFDEFALNESQMKLYPNPTNGDFTMELYGVQGQQVELEIVDIAGRTVLLRPLGTNDMLVRETVSLDVSSGIYLVTVSNGTSAIQKRIVIR